MKRLVRHSALRSFLLSGFEFSFQPSMLVKIVPFQAEQNTIIFCSDYIRIRFGAHQTQSSCTVC